MKTLLMSLLGLYLVTSLPAQDSADNPPRPRLTAEELAELLGPIALYPDALIALILPASTAPSDIVLGARYVATGGKPDRVEDKSWDSSVKALTRYPDTLKWLDENLEWTAQVGDAFIEQPVEVMEAIQQLRAKARALGNLVDTPQQRIVQEETYIRIIPAQPDYIYEPRYDPEVIYYERPLLEPLLFFSIGYGVGSWLNYDCDWHRHRLYRGDWNGGWDYSRDRNRRDRDDYYVNNNLTNSRQWQPDRNRHRTQSHRVTEYVTERTNSGDSSRNRTQSRKPGVAEPRDHHKGIARPNPIAGAPHHRESGKRADSTDGRKPDHKSDTRTAHDSNSKEDRKADHQDERKGRVSSPKTNPPGITKDSKNDRDGRDGRDGRDQADHKNKDDSKKGDSPPPVIRHSETPSGNAEKKLHVDDPPKHKSTRVEEPKHRDAPKRDDAPKQPDKMKRDEPRHQDAPKRNDAPKQSDKVKRDEPRHQDAPKHAEAPKRDAPKQEAAKRHDEPTRDKGKKSDKKKDEDKDKKKQ